MEGYMAEIRLFGANFAPRNWAYCQGQILAINTNTALFSLLGTTYGGNGVTTFALPDFRSRMVVGTGTVGGLPTYQLGELSGRETNTLTQLNLPVHSHPITSAPVVKVSASDGISETPGNNMAIGALADASGGGGTPNFGYNNTTPDIPLNNGIGGNTGIAGGNSPVMNLQPSLGMSYVICMYGIFPSRN
jgi:microcystin-dependent protein